MEVKEKQLFQALCKFKDEINGDLVNYATPSVLGLLFFNRMQGVAFDTLRRNGLLGKVNREFRNSLGAAHEQNVAKNESFFTCVAMLSDIISKSSCKIAMLKGAYLCSHYPTGYRTSNDVDLLVSPNDVGKIGNLLTTAGFVQGNIRNGEFVPATRKEIIESKMTRGETVPYIKQVDLPYMKFFEVDINFSLDYKTSTDDTLSRMLNNICVKNENGIYIKTLENTDFFIHLCAHLYKEATTLPWIKMHRDMTMYKYCDIYLLLSEMSESQVDDIFRRAKEFDMEKICAYAILETSNLFDMDFTYAYNKATLALEDDPDFCLKVISPSEKKLFTYQTKSTLERFFMNNRQNDLKEI